MKDTRSIQDNASILSHISEIDYQLPPTPPTPKIKAQRPVRLPPIRPKPKAEAEAAAAAQRKKKPSGYAPPASDRESWWRTTIKDTPNPGTYDTHLNTFIKEIVARPMTYGFKSDGRRRDPQPLEPKGKELLPGAYSVEDFAAQ
jgi:hypothetical protein